MQAKARHTFTQAKRLSWRNYTSTITARIPPVEIWKKIKILEGKKTFHLLPLLTHCNNPRSDSTEIANLLTDHFATASNTGTPLTNYNSYNDIIENADEPYN